MSLQRRADPGFAADRRAKAGQFLTAADEIMGLASLELSARGRDEPPGARVVKPIGELDHRWCG